MTLAPLRVAAVQAEAVAGDVQANVVTAVAAVRDAALSGARLAVLPELFLPGYDIDTLRARPDDCDVTVDDPRLVPLSAAARDHRVSVVVGASVRRPSGDRTVSLLAFSPGAEPSVVYDKQHLWSEERALFTPGENGAGIELAGWALGLGVCYDGCFPEHARAGADAGTLAYLCPSAYVVGSEHRRDLYYAARALDNGIYVVLPALVGRCGSTELSGGTAIFDPQGRRVAQVASGSGIAVADLDVAAVHEARTINPYVEDRPASLGGHVRISLGDLA